MGQFCRLLLPILIATESWISQAVALPTPEAQALTTLPHETSFAQLWQDMGEWSNGTEGHDLSKRMNVPGGRSQFVSWAKSGQNLYTISLAVVLFNTGDKCSALYDGLVDNGAVATTVAASAANFIRGHAPNTNALATEAYFTRNYYGSIVVISKLLYSTSNQLFVAVLAQQLADWWELGEVIASYEPTNSKRDEQGSVGSFGVVSRGSYSQEELIKLRDILESLPQSGAAKVEEVEKRAGLPNCLDWDLRYCRNEAWSVWDTQYSAGC